MHTSRPSLWIPTVPAFATLAKVWVALVVGLLVAACGSASAGGGYALPGVDVAGGDGAIGKDANPTETASPDATATVADPAADAIVDAGPSNTAPTFDDLSVLSLDQGSSTTLNVAPFLHDAQDPVAKLKLSWSAKHVALKDPGDHKLYVVAPTTWTGTEPIELTVTDTAGATAATMLTVVVKPVTVPQPVPTECGKHTFTYKAGAGSHTVLLSGSFNGWANTADKADAMTDPGSTGTYAVVK
ncbi:MAG: hypothetical protein HY902_07615, partial [Deltaproteobacteria bacterium]|nr:hypothetical protein [Deltaproteobacteria bacterium]